MRHWMNTVMIHHILWDYNVEYIVHIGIDEMSSQKVILLLEVLDVMLFLIILNIHATDSQLDVLERT
jgi:hypothetical protein